MTNRVTTTGIKGNTYETLFRRQIKRVKQWYKQALH